MEEVLDSLNFDDEDIHKLIQGSIAKDHFDPDSYIGSRVIGFEDFMKSGVKFLLKCQKPTKKGIIHSYYYYLVKLLLL